MKSIPYGRQDIIDEDISAVIETLKSDYLTQGPKIKEFEEEFAKYVGAKYAVAVNNATSALHIAARALGVSSEDDRVIVTPLTFASSANCVRFCGGEVVFSDIDKDTYLLDIEKLTNLLESKPKGYYKGIIPVDFAGYPCNMENLRSLANKYGMWIIEDACHAPGGSFIDSEGVKQRCGNGVYSDITVFSFHPVKHIATGEGGMLTTNNEELYRQLCLLRTHGITKDEGLMRENHGGWYYEMIDLGYNYRITDFQAALGTSQLKRAENGVRKRNEIADVYNRAFENVEGVKVPFVDASVYHAYHLYVIQIENRLELYNYLKKHNIFSQVHYSPLHLMPYYQKLGNKKGDLPIVEDYYEHCLSLPMYPTLTQEEQRYVIDKIRNFVNE